MPSVVLAVGVAASATQAERDVVGVPRSGVLVTRRGVAVAAALPGGGVVIVPMPGSLGSPRARTRYTCPVCQTDAYQAVGL